MALHMIAVRWHLESGSYTSLFDTRKVCGTPQVAMRPYNPALAKCLYIVQAEWTNLAE